MHGEHLQALLLGFWDKFCKELRDDSRETWLGRISISGVFLGFFQSLLNTLLSIRHKSGCVFTMRGSTCLSPEHRPLCPGASVQTTESWELPRWPCPSHPSTQCPPSYSFHLPIPPSQEKEDPTSLLFWTLPPQSCCLKNHFAAQH